MRRPERRLDTTGTYCPLPILMTERELAQLAAGDQLEVIGDDPAILEDMPAWCAATGHRLARIQDRAGTIVCLVEKGAATRLSP